jgi:competence protein ComEC
LTDGAAVAMACGAVLGAYLAVPLPIALPVAAVLLAWRAGRPLLLVVAITALASVLAAKSWNGLRPPRSAAVRTVATLLTDPEPVAGALRVELRIGRRHVEAWARGAAAGGIYRREAGQRIEVEGRLRAVPHAFAARLAPRHIAAQLVVTSTGEWWPGSPLARMANGLRDTLTRGAASLGRRDRSLFGGFVLGDDREQPPEVADDFRAAGLTHLLVVSGENVAFVLALAGPLLRRLAFRWRVVTGVGVLVVFGAVTRWEPSVLRADAMAVVTLIAASAGRPVSSLRALALAVTALVLVDPMLVRSVGFLLSVGACVGIATLAQPIARRLPGPRPVAAAMAVTVAAQVGVAPVLIPVFGPLPVAALPANLLAIPAAGPIMVWGMTAGFAAGLVPRWLASLMHLPTRALIGWVAGVAHVAAGVPLGHVGIGAAVALSGAALLAALSRRAAGVVLVLMVAAGPLGFCRTASNQLLTDEPVAGLQVWRDRVTTVVAIGAADAARVLPALRRAHIGRIDLLVVVSASARAGEAVRAVTSRLRVGTIAGPGAGSLRAGDAINVGRWRVTFEAVSPRLVIAVCAHPPATVVPCS